MSKEGKEQITEKIQARDSRLYEKGDDFLKYLENKVENNSESFAGFSKFFNFINDEFKESEATKLRFINCFCNNFIDFINNETTNDK